MFTFTQGIPRDNFNDITFLMGFEDQPGLIATSKTMSVSGSSVSGIDVAFLVVEGEIPFTGMESITVFFCFFFVFFFFLSQIWVSVHSCSGYFYGFKCLQFFWKPPNVFSFFFFLFLFFFFFLFLFSRLAHFNFSLPLASHVFSDWLIFCPNVAYVFFFFCFFFCFFFYFFFFLLNHPNKNKTKQKNSFATATEFNIISFVSSYDVTTSVSFVDYLIYLIPESVIGDDFYSFFADMPRGE